jgi:DNA recombination protein RmuC
MTLHGKLQQETNMLTRALHHSSARGHWGELQLRRVVEMAGMIEHCDFDEQVSVSSREGARLRPDMVIRLAGGRSIGGDAKAPMDNYLKSQEAGDRGLEHEFLARHARDVRARMSELGAKAYWDAFDDAPEFVVMFFPSENVFSDALKFDADLIDFGAANGVIPASPVTLIALLRAAAYGWRQEKATENAKLIFELGCELHDRFAKEYQHLANLGIALSRAVDSFNKSAGSAERMLFPTLRKFSGLVGKDLFPAPAEIEPGPRRLTAEAAEETSVENEKSRE